MTLYQDCSSRHDLSKNMAASGGGGGGGVGGGGWGAGLIFPIYLYRKLEIILKPMDRFQYNLAGMFLW